MPFPRRSALLALAASPLLPWSVLAQTPGGKLDELAKKHGASPSQLALAWLLKRSPVMLPIPGTKSVDHLEDNLKAADLQLSDDEVAELEQAV